MLIPLNCRCGSQTDRTSCHWTQDVEEARLEPSTVLSSKLVFLNASPQESLVLTESLWIRREVVFTGCLCQAVRHKMCTLRSDSTESRWGWLRGSSLAMSHFPSGRVNDRSLESSQAAHLVLSTSQTTSKFFFRTSMGISSLSL